MGNEQSIPSPEEAAKAKAAFDAVIDIDAMKKKHDKAAYVAQYRKILAEKRAHAAEKQAPTSQAPPVQKPQLIRSSKGGATSKAPVVKAPLFVEDSDDDVDDGEILEQSPEEEDLLSGWNARKEPRNKSATSSGAHSGSDDVVQGEETSSRVATELAERPKKSSTAPAPSVARPNPSSSSMQTTGFSSIDGVVKRTSGLPKVNTAITQAKPLGGGSASATSANPGQKKRTTPDTPAEERRPSKASKATAVASPQSPDGPQKQSGLAGLGRIPKKHGTSQAEKRAVPLATTTSIEERPPRWYSNLQNVAGRNPSEANADTLMKSLKKLVKDWRKQSRETQASYFDSIRDKLHKLPFERVSGQLLRNNRMLHNEDGLPQLFDPKYTGGAKWPWDIKADAEELYNKWCRQIFETDLLRGIIRGRPASKKGGDDGTVDEIDPQYKGQISLKFHGNGLLINGQWWPTQLCTIRDGAHGEMIAGISGSKSEGAYSCVMSGGHDYPDEDHGDWVLYCGTDSKDGSITTGTRRLLDCEEHKGEPNRERPVRLIRSHNLKSEYAPEIGFRYDGLYKVVSHENLDGATSLRQRHRFRLERLPGQAPIRGTGPEKRPTMEEIEAHQKDKHLRGYK